MSPSDPTPEEKVARMMNSFRGRLAGFIEACDLDARKERNIISTMKSYSYDVEKTLQDLLRQ